MDTVIPNGQPAPSFCLPTLDGEIHTLGDWRGRVVVLNFWSSECPWSERADRVLLAYLEDWGEAVVLCSIASNVNEADDLMIRVAAQRGLPLVLRDSKYQVADLYGAQTTPHFFVLDPEGILRFQGPLDDITWRQPTPTRFYLHQAVEAVLAGAHPDPAQVPPYGCAIVRYR